MFDIGNIAPWTGAGGVTGYNSIRARFEVLMSYDSKFPDPLQAWHKVLERWYHEDHILYARMNNFSSVQAFLATALAFTTSATTIARNISLIVALFGLSLCRSTFRSVSAASA
jgi:hypothetical protein